MANVNWDDFRFVLALYRQGSISAAAHTLDVNETTVARRLAQVECSLDTRLFERERGRVLPTAEAVTVINRLIAIDDQFQHLHDEASGANLRVEGSVRVTAAPMIANQVLVPRLHNIQKQHPKLEIELLVDSALLGIATRRDADIALRGGRPDSDGDAITRKLGVMTSADIPWIAYAPTLSLISRVQADWMDEQIALEGCLAQTRVNDGESLVQCVLSGLGKALLADGLGQRCQSLQRLPFQGALPSREMWMLIHPSYREVKRIEVTAAWLAEEIKAFLTPEQIDANR